MVSLMELIIFFIFFILNRLLDFKFCFRNISKFLGFTYPNKNPLSIFENVILKGLKSQNRTIF